MSTKKDFISIKNLTEKEIENIFELSDKLKKSPAQFSQVLKSKVLAMIFQKPSCRTQVSFEVGMFQLGGASFYLGPEQLKLGSRETTGDIARTLSRYVDGIVLRTFAHKNVLEMAQCAGVAVINALTDLLHPCQALSDIYTIRERFPDLNKVKLAFVGDGNNVCHSLVYGCSKVGLNLNIATPKGYAPEAAVLQEAKSFAKSTGAEINVFDNAKQAAKGADIIYTDVWASMGQEEEAKKRKQDFKDFQVNSSLLSLAQPGCLIMHCLPAHRGEEITDEVLDSANSVVFDQAENRLHVQKAILVQLLGK